ncbi:MAG: GspE/PulE family protein [Parcubacteria group bacterium]|jgi:type IV pilus assembly protein PilB
MGSADKTKNNKTGVNKGDAGERAESLSADVLEVAPKNIEGSIINILPQEVAQKNRMVVFAKEGAQIKVAMADPQDINALNVLRFFAEKEKVEIRTYRVAEKILEDMLEFYTGPLEMVKDAVKSFNDDIIFNGEVDTKNAERKKEEVLKDAPVTKLVQVIISHAIEGKASDIHIEPMDKDYRVRFRVDGILHVSLVLPKELGPVVISRVKILANLKIDEKRKPQDGRFRLTNDGKEIDFRVSSLPVIDGEKVVMRILDKEVGIANVESLGLLGSALTNMKAAIEETYGMILVTGPTGSGKSTTLYALLKILNSEERNIITLEDPIEYNIEGLNQSQIKPEIGYTFASGLRTILRQDPNVIMVGEIRDAETAELAVHAALTGHLMFSTLHTNTATGAIPRLIDMGIEPFLLSSSLRVVVAQRLVRKICPDCKTEQAIAESIQQQIREEIKNISPEELQKYGLDLSAGLKFYHGQGCDTCNNTGLKGRLAIYEVVPVTDKIKEIMIEKRGNENLVKAERDKAGVLTIKQDGILKILSGMTTIEEVERVVEGSIALAEENF